MHTPTFVLPSLIMLNKQLGKCKSMRNESSVDINISTCLSISQYCSVTYLRKTGHGYEHLPTLHSQNRVCLHACDDGVIVLGDSVRTLGRSGSENEHGNTSRVRLA